MLFTYLHLAPDPELTRGLVDSGATCIAYETVDDARRPPAAAGADERGRRQDRHAGRRVHAREAARRPRASCSAACPACPPAKVMVIGGGVVGMNAAFIAIGMEAEVYVFDRNIDRLRELDVVLRRPRSTRASPRRWRSSSACPRSTSSSAPCSSTAPRRRTWSPASSSALMKRTRCSSTSRSTRAAASRPRAPTTHTDPTYEVDGITHYCVANMPGAVPITSTYALTNATMPYVIKLATDGVHARAELRPRLPRRPLGRRAASSPPSRSPSTRTGSSSRPRRRSHRARRGLIGAAVARRRAGGAPRRRSPLEQLTGKTRLRPRAR